MVRLLLRALTEVELHSRLTRHICVVYPIKESRDALNTGNSHQQLDLSGSHICAPCNKAWWRHSGEYGHKYGHRNGGLPEYYLHAAETWKNLYPTLSIEENLQFFGGLFGHSTNERRRRIDELTTSTGLYLFLNHPMGKLTGGMRQKLGMCCALIHDLELLIYDELTTGADPLARKQFWDLIARVRSHCPEMSVIVATAYMDEAERFEWLVVMDAGRILATGTPSELHERTGTTSLEAAFIAPLPEEKKRNHRAVVIPLLADEEGKGIAIEACDLTMGFGYFTAVDYVNFRIHRCDIFGLIGSNACGKSTTMKTPTGLLPADKGQAWLFGHEVNPHDIATRRRVGYISLTECHEVVTQLH